MTQDKFIEFFLKQEKEKEQRPEMMDRPAMYYEHESSVYPEIVRISFRDGSTQIYELRTPQPAPQIIENIRIIRSWGTGYPQKHRRAQR